MKVLLVVTNHDQLGNTGNKTGWYLPEVAHPHKVFVENGFTITYVSPKGGKAPMDPGSYDPSKDDPVSNNFYADPSKMALLNNTRTPDQVKSSDFNVIFYAGGHGPMFDLPDNEAIAQLAAEIYENGGVVGAVCHGTVGLIPVTLKNGEKLLKGKTVTSFTNAEEEVCKLTDAMPFPLETRLKEEGANFVGVANFAANVQVSERVVTGQNPASASPTAEAIVKLLK